MRVICPITEPNMSDQCANIKAELEENHQGLTALAQLVAIYTTAGIATAAEIATRTGYSDRAIRKAMAELRCRNPGAVAEPEFRNPSAAEPEFRNPGAESGTPVPSSRAECINNITTTKEIITTTPLNPPKPSKRGSRLDPDWQLPADWQMWARTNFPASTDAQVFDQAAQFRDFWIAKPGAQACKLDWEATWRNWCRKGLSAYGMVRKPQYTGAYRQTAEVIPYKSIPAPSRPMTPEEREAWIMADEALAVAHG